jgi:AGZA family xanthine/uracil permease-like MFS transporter
VHSDRGVAFRRISFSWLSFFSFSGICLKLGLPWPIALTSCFFQGLLFLFLALIGACDLIQLYAPPCIKKSISVGLGLFQALIGFELMRLVIPGTETLLSIGNIYDAKIWLCVGGMMLICVLLVWKVKAAMLVGIMFITLASWALELTPLPDALIEMPTLQRPMAMLDFAGFFERIHDTLPVVLVMLFVSVFDTAGVQYMCGSEADLLDPQTDTLPGAKAAFASAGVATAIGQ